MLRFLCHVLIAFAISILIRFVVLKFSTVVKNIYTTETESVGNMSGIIDITSEKGFIFFSPNPGPREIVSHDAQMEGAINAMGDPGQSGKISQAVQKIESINVMGDLGQSGKIFQAVQKIESINVMGDPGQSGKISQAVQKKNLENPAEGNQDKGADNQENKESSDADSEYFCLAPLSVQASQYSLDLGAVKSIAGKEIVNQTSTGETIVNQPTPGKQIPVKPISAEFVDVPLHDIPEKEKLGTAAGNDEAEDAPDRQNACNCFCC